MQPQLRAPGQRDDLRRQVRLARLEGAGHVWGVAHVVSRFAQDVPQQADAGPGDRATLLLTAT
jgi:hypothetical protein